LRIADFHFAAAKFNWQKRRFFCGLLDASNAMDFSSGHGSTLYASDDAAASPQPLGEVARAVTWGILT
jgi:hypothetical protein